MAIRRRRDIWDVVVIGGGIAGLTAAQQCARRGLATALLESAPGFGGLVATVNELDDWPATSETSGVALGAALADQARAAGVEIIQQAALSLKPVEPLQVATEGKHLKARRVIVASGARLRALGVPGEEELRGNGVSQCADCDSGFFRGQDVVVVGGGDAALQEALILARTCRTVHIVVRSALRARRAYVDKAASMSNVKFIWDCAVDAVLGEQALSGITLRNVKTGAQNELACTGVFPFVGSQPNSEFLPSEIARNAAGAVTTDMQYRTSLPQVFAAGAVRAGYCGDLVAAAGEAAAAAAVIAGEING